jgi:hypothetical protein
MADKEYALCESVEPAVHAVFDENKGARLNMDHVAAIAARFVDDTVRADYSAFRDAVYAVLRSDAFEIKKGRNGGVSRLADDND